MIKTKNLDELLDKKRVRELLIKYQTQCQLSQNIVIKNIFRTMVLSPNTYAILLEIENNNLLRKIRINASNEETRERAYHVMKYLQPEFSGPKYFIPKIFFYDADYNLVAYENIEGPILIKQLADQEIQEKIILVSEWLEKLHSIPLPKIKLPKHEIFFNYEALKKYYPDLSKDAPKIIENLRNKLEKFSSKLIHGDYQPNNIIVNQNQITLFDFIDSHIDDPALDLAKFLSQLKVMLFRFADPGNYQELEKTFLENYQLDYCRSNFRIYYKIYLLQILCTLSASLTKDPEADTTLPEIKKYYEEANV